MSKNNPDIQSLDLISLEINRMVLKQQKGGLDNNDIRTLETLIKIRLALLASPNLTMTGMMQALSNSNQTEHPTDAELMEILAN